MPIKEEQKVREDQEVNNRSAMLELPEENLEEV